MIIFTQIKPKYNKMSVFPSLLNLQTILIGESMDLKSGSLIHFYMLVDQSEEVYNNISYPVTPHISTCAYSKDN